MSYETKVLLIALGKIVKLSKSVKEVYDCIAQMANVEGVILEKYEDRNEYEDEKGNGS